MNRSKIIKVLLIEDNPGDVRLIREMLTEGGGGRFDLECVGLLSTGMARLAEGGTTESGRASSNLTSRPKYRARNLPVAPTILPCWSVKRPRG